MVLKTLADLPQRVEQDGVLLRPLNAADIDERYLAWFDDPAVTQFLEARHLSREAVLAHLNYGLETHLRHMYAICDRESGLHIGNCKIGDIQPAHQISDLVTVIGDRAFWGCGLGAIAIRLGQRIAFDHLGLRKLSGAIHGDNAGSRKAYAAAGWVEEGVQRAQILRRGQAIDRILVARFNPVFFPEAPPL